MRADVYLTQKGFCESRNKASKLIGDGLVSIDGRTVSKASDEINEDVYHEVAIDRHDMFVGRGGLKLEAALDAFCVDVKGKRCIDVGASTGGFTQCLLMHGADSVVAVDSGREQLHKSLTLDPRVRSVEGYNARNLNEAEFGMFDGAVMDVSFISQTLIIPALSALIRQDGFFISLVKPQFEAGRQAIGKNGIVKRPADRELSVLKVAECAQACGMSPLDVIRSPIKGGDGNIEYLAYFVRKNCAEKLSESITEKIHILCRE